MPRLSSLLTFAAFLAPALSLDSGVYRFHRGAQDDFAPATGTCLQPSDTEDNKLLMRAAAWTEEQWWRVQSSADGTFTMTHYTSNCNARREYTNGASLLVCDNGQADYFTATASNLGGPNGKHVDLYAPNSVVDSRLNYAWSEPGHEVTFTSPTNEATSALFNVIRLS